MTRSGLSDTIHTALGVAPGRFHMVKWNYQGGGAARQDEGDEMTTTYTVQATWDSGKPSGQGSFTRIRQTEAQAERIRREVREWAPLGSTHRVTVRAER